MASYERCLSSRDVIDKALDKEVQEDNISILAAILKAESPNSDMIEEIGTKTEAKKEIEITDDQAEAIHLALQTLSCVCDGAVAIDGAGFNKFDSEVGKSLASRHTLTTKQAALGRKLVNKYRRQVSDDILTAIFGQEASK